MTVCLFTALRYLLLVLFMCGTLLCTEVFASSKTYSTAENAVVLFKENMSIDVLKPNGIRKTNAIIVEDFYSPFLVATDDMMVAVVKAKRASNFEILTKYIKNEKFVEHNNVTNTKNDWKTQFAVRNEAGKNNSDINVNGLLAAAKEDKIYLLLVDSGTRKIFYLINSSEFKLKFVVGKVTDNKGNLKKKLSGMKINQLLMV